MPHIMSLEGPQLARLGQLRGQLYAVAPKPFRRVGVALNGFLDPIVLPVKAHPWMFLVGLIGGAYYFTIKGKSKGKAKR